MQKFIAIYTISDAFLMTCLNDEEKSISALSTN
jgi:hypothetical protein